jgi:cellulose biosynthesis protein BcsQ
VLIPYTPDYLSLEGIKWMRQLHAAFSERVGYGNIARLTGVIVNRVKSAPNQQYVNAQVQALSELGHLIDQLHQLHGYRLRIFEPHIAESTLVSEATNYQETLLQSDPNHPVTRQFAGLTADILTHLRRIAQRTPE